MGLEYRAKIGKVPFSVTGTAGISRTTGPGIAGSQVEGKALIGLSIPLHLL